MPISQSIIVIDSDDKTYQESVVQHLAYDYDQCFYLLSESFVATHMRMLWNKSAALDQQEQLALLHICSAMAREGCRILLSCSIEGDDFVTKARNICNDLDVILRQVNH